MATPVTPSELTENIRLFKNLWRGGYWAGDPLDPTGRTDYGFLGYVSMFHAVYHGCIRPYISSATHALEIGCGRGAWTRTMLGAKEVWCLDALSAEHNGFWPHIGPQDHVHYIHVQDFSCVGLPDNYFDFLFSFGCFCHIPQEGQLSYYRNLWPKLKSGANCFIMFGDFDKFRRAVRAARRITRFDLRAIISGLRHERAMRYYARRAQRDGPDNTPGRWYDFPTGTAAAQLDALGYRVICPDLNINQRDPIIHFTKP